MILWQFSASHCLLYILSITGSLLKQILWMLVPKPSLEEGMRVSVWMRPESGFVANL